MIEVEEKFLLKMTKTYIPEDAERSGIDISYTKKTQMICIGGWYDSCAGLESQTFKLSEFFQKLGITEKDCIKAFKKENKL
jgi:hypothetical protein